MSFFRRLAGISVAHQDTVGRLFLYSFLTSASYVTARTTGDSLMLSQLGPGFLPAMILISAAAVIVVMAVSVLLSRNTGIRRIIFVTRILLAMTTVALAVFDQLPWSQSMAVSLLMVAVLYFRPQGLFPARG